MRADFVWVLLGRIATAFIAIASLRIMTYSLEPKHYGIYALLIAFQGFCGLFLINPVGQHINRHTHAWWDDGTLLKRLFRYNSYILAVSGFISIVVTVWWLLYPGTDGYIASSIAAACAVAAMVYMGTWNGTFVYILAMLGFRVGSVFWMTASSVVGLALSTIFVYQYHTATSWVLGQVLGMAIGAIGAGIMLRRHHLARKVIINPNNEFPKLLNRQAIVGYCMPLAAATGFMWLQNSGYRFWVGGVWGAAELGVLAIGLAIASQLWSIFESLMTQFLHPYFFRHITEAKTNEQEVAILSDMVNVMWPLYAVFAGFNLLFASSLLTVLTDVRYHDAVAFVTIGALIEFVRCTTNLWSYAAQVKRRTKRVILPYGLGALILLLLVLAVIYSNGSLHMLSVGLVISSIVTSITMIVLMQRMLPVMIDVRRWLAGSVVFILSLLITVVMPIQNHGFYQSVTLLLFGMISSGSCMTLILWRNPALIRLLSVSLRSV